MLKSTNNKSITGHVLNKLQLDQNIEELFYYFLAFVLLNHLSACFWYLLAKSVDFAPDSWVSRLGFADASDIEVKLFSFIICRYILYLFIGV